MTLLEADPKEIKKTYGAVFYWTLKFLNKKTVTNVSLLYAFFRYTRDMANLPNKSSSKEMLGVLEEELDAPSHTFMARLTEILSQLNIKKLYAKEIISAARFDLSGKGVQNQNQLMIYCYKNYGAFGLLMAPALGARDFRAGPFAVDLGIASNLTGICRSVLADAQNGKAYLPLSELRDANLTLKDLACKGNTPKELKRIVKKYLDLAESYYESAVSGLSYLPLRARFGLLVAMRMRQEIGRKIKRQNYEVLKGKTRLSSLEKGLVCAKTSLEILRPKFWVGGEHRGFLHSTLLGLPGVVVSKGVGAE